MAKITRKTAIIFANSPGTNQIAQFGSLAAASPVFSTDPAVIQALTAWNVGWFNAVENQNSPAIEDMNAVHYVNSYQIGYLLQQGLAEWDAGTTYFQNQFVSSSGVAYVSLQNTNLNHSVSSTSWWKTYVNFEVQATGALLFPDGTISNPSISFVNETGSGFYRDNTGSFSAVINGVVAASFNGTTFTVPTQLYLTHTSNQIEIQPGGSGTIYVLTATNPGQNTVLTLPDPGSSTANVLLSKGGAIVSGAWTFGSQFGVNNSVTIKGDGVNNGLVVDSSNKVSITGVTDGSNASAGIVGELLESYSGGGASPAYVNAGATGAYFDIASLSLTAGDWDIYLQGEYGLNSATATETAIGISTTTGNSSTGLVNGKTYFDVPLPINSDSTGFSFPYHFDVSATTTIYLKGFAAYSAGTPRARAYLWARRRR